MVSNIDHFEYILTNSELDAFSLESNLIKKHKPKYNIMLKDDKSFPYLKINYWGAVDGVTAIEGLINDLTGGENILDSAPKTSI